MKTFPLILPSLEKQKKYQQNIKILISSLKFIFGDGRKMVNTKFYNFLY